MVKKNNKLLNRKFIKYLIPGILLAMALRFTSVIDGVLIGNRLGSVQLTASSLAVSALYLCQIPGYALGLGASIAISTYIGNRNIKGAGHAASISLITIIILGLVFTALAFPLSEVLANFLSDGDVTYLVYIRIYILVYWLSSPIIGLLLFFSYLMAVDNHPYLSTWMVGVSSIGKIIFMIVTLFPFNYENNLELGMYLASFSTGVGALLSFVIIIPYMKSKKRLVKFSFKIASPMKHLLVVIKAGLVAFLTYLLTAISLFVVNATLSRVLTGNELLIYGVMANITFCIDLFVAGVIQLIPSLVGVLYGEEDYRAVKSLTKKMVLITEAIALVIVSVFMIYPRLLMIIFDYDGGVDTYAYAYECIRIYLITVIFYEINMFMQTYYPSIERTLPAVVNSILRTAGLALPLIIILSSNYGLVGYSYANALTEGLTFVITIGFILLFYKLRKSKFKGVLLLPRLETIDDYDVTIGTSEEDALEVGKKIKEFALKHKFSEENASSLEKAGTEIIKSIQSYGYKGKNDSYIDVNLRMKKRSLILKIRDDGIVFNEKVERDAKSDVYKAFSDAKDLVSSVEYIRVINLNNTVIKISR